MLENLLSEITSKLSMFNLMVYAGLFFSLLFLLKELKDSGRDNNHQNKILTAFPFALIFAGVFAHLFDVYFHEGFFALFTKSILKYGITFLGGLVGALVYLYIHSRIAKISYIYLLNIYVPLFALGQAFGRIGCFFGGCCYGKPCEYFGFSYDETKLAYGVYADAKLFPIQLLESLFLFVLFFILTKITAFKNRAYTYFISIAIARTIFECFRGDNRGEVAGGFISPAQCLSLFILCFGIAIFIKQQKQKIKGKL